MSPGRFAIRARTVFVTLSALQPHALACTSTRRWIRASISILKCCPASLPGYCAGVPALHAVAACHRQSPSAGSLTMHSSRSVIPSEMLALAPDGCRGDSVSRLQYSVCGANHHVTLQARILAAYLLLQELHCPWTLDQTR